MNNTFQFVQLDDKQNPVQIFVVSKNASIPMRYRNGTAEKNLSIHLPVRPNS